MGCLVWGWITSYRNGCSLPSIYPSTCILTYYKIELQFIKYQSHNIIPSSLTHLAHIDNLICLFANCHGLFDDQQPDLVIVPTDLTFFIEWEQRDFKARCEAAKKGGIQSWTVPTRRDYPGKYWLVDNKERLPEKTWKGCPTALILKSCFGLLRPVFPESDNSRDNYLSPELKLQLTKLLSNQARGQLKPQVPKLKAVRKGKKRRQCRTSRIIKESGPAPPTRMLTRSHIDLLQLRPHRRKPAQKQPEQIRRGNPGRSHCKRRINSLRNGQCPMDAG
jgi:hypothetical protein